MFQLAKTVHFRSAPESKGSQIKQVEWNTYFNWREEASKRLQNSQIASLKDSLPKDNKTIKIQEIPKIKDCKTDVNSYSPLSPPCLIILVLCLHCLPTLKRLHDCKQKPIKLVALRTLPYLPSKKDPHLGSSRADGTPWILL